MTQPSDCLVLKIEEVDSATDKIDTQIFVLFDKHTHKYVLRGKRNDSCNTIFETFSFICETSDDVTIFLSFIIDNNNLVMYALYNNADLPWLSDDIYFEDLNKNAIDKNELAAYTKERFSKKILKNRIRILRNVFNLI